MEGNLLHVGRLDALNRSYDPTDIKNRRFIPKRDGFEVDRGGEVERMPDIFSYW